MLEWNSIHNMDCLTGLSQLPEQSVHLAFADPPFNIGYDYDVYHDQRGADDYLNWCREWLTAVLRVLRPDGTFWLAIGDEYAAELKVMMQRELGLTCRSWVIWYYTFGVNCKMKFSRSHAHLFHMVRAPAQFTFNVDSIRVPSARQLVYGDKRANPKGRLPDDTWILRPQDLPEGFQADGDTWYFPRVAGTFHERAGWHGCQMPEQLLGRIIRACSNEGDIVLDPFGGSGTTLAVAKKLKRQFVGFELSDSYAQNIQDRLAQITPGDLLNGAEEPLVSAPSTAAGRKLDEQHQPKRKIVKRSPNAASKTNATQATMKQGTLLPLDETGSEDSA
ncbi:MAG: site-specific DNA-methyltransferase [Planctomycetales bacterium]|nr:site-specific DNA-methyltransferase [Planctomycetales bacterium]